MRGILSPTPADLVDLLLDLERLEVVKLGLVRLELGVELVLAALLLRTAKTSRGGRKSQRKCPVHALVHRQQALRCCAAAMRAQAMTITHRLIPLEQHHTTALVARGKIVARMVEFDRRDNVGCEEASAASVCARQARSGSAEPLATQPQRETRACLCCRNGVETQRIPELTAQMYIKPRPAATAGASCLARRRLMLQQLSQTHPP